jgi:hypothetical protein
MTTEANNPRTLGWISVTDRLPPNRDEVVVAAYNYRLNRIALAIGFHATDPNMWNIDGDWLTRSDCVKYWMPLPELPAEPEPVDGQKPGCDLPPMRMNP